MQTKRHAILTTATALLLTASLAHAQMVQGPGSAASPPPPVQVDARPGVSPGNAALSPEKMAAVRTIQSYYAEGLFSLRQDIRAKQAELNAIMLKLQPDTAKAKTVYRDIARLQTMEADILIDMHARISTETDVRLPMPPMGLAGTK